MSTSSRLMSFRGRRSRCRASASSRSSHSAPAGQPVARLTPLPLVSTSPASGERREVLRDRLPRDRQLACQLGRRRRAALRTGSRARRRLGSASAPKTCPSGSGRHRLSEGECPACSSSAVDQAGDVSTTVSRVPSASSSSVNSTSPSSSHSKARRRSGSTSVTVAWRSSPFVRRNLAPPPGRSSTRPRWRTSLRAARDRSAPPRPPRAGGQDGYLFLIMCNLRVALDSRPKLHVSEEVGVVG